LSQTAESHTPSWSASYFDSFISFFAAWTSPRWFGLGYGSYRSPAKSRTVGGMMCVAISPWMGPPQAFWSVALSITKLTALRTCTSSNGGVR
jgi:hypothetical protein